MDDSKERTGIRFFDAVLDATAIDALHAASRRVVFQRGATLMRQGEPGQSMFTIISGKVVVSVQERDGEHKVAELGPDDYVGEMSLLTGEPRTATVTAKGRVVALETPKAALQPILAGAPHLARQFADMVKERQAQLVQLHQDYARWNSVGFDPARLAARMTAFYSG
jgi:CRP-like cAMP-binding protein